MITNIIYYKLNSFNYYEKISSLIFLKGGTIILSTNSEEKIIMEEDKNFHFLFFKKFLYI